MAATDPETTEEDATFRMPRPSPTLTALTTSALALPGISGSARADTPIERAEARYAFSYYWEEDIPARKTDLSTGSQERFEVFTDQFRFDIPTSERTDIGIDILYEEMSGASPWFVTFDTVSGSTLQVMSGATIDDQRLDMKFDLDYYLDEGKDNFAVGFSQEKDYLSVFGSLGSQRHFNDKNTTLDVASSFSYDWVEPTGGGTLGRIEEDTKWSLDLFAGLSQIISRHSTAQLTINFKHSEGFLNDPYKLIQIIGPGGANIPDVRPGERNQVSLMARYRHHFENIESSVHGDYRFFVDDWGIVSHTIELAWYQQIGEFLTITPSARWYSQSKADFYEPFLDALFTPATAPAERSSDYRLSPYGAVSVRIKADLTLEDLFEYDADGAAELFGITDGFDLVASLSYERYMQDGSFGLDEIGEFEQAPALLEYNVVAFTLNGRF